MNFWIILIVSIILPAKARSDDSALEMKLEALSTNIFARMAELEAKNNDLEERLAEVDPTIFDCSLIQDWSTNGIITFEGCSVDTTTGDPLTGSFTVGKPGFYRLTFTGQMRHPAFPNGDVDATGYVFIKVDGDTVATAENYILLSKSRDHP